MASVQDDVIFYRFAAMNQRSGAASIFLPLGACDCHIHILDDGPGATTVPLVHASGAWEDYELEAVQAGIERVVVVQPSFYGFNNGFLCETLKSLGQRARGIAVVPPNVPRSVLAELNEAGVRGVRFNLVSGGLGLDSLEEIARRIRPFGWHVQLFVDSTRFNELIPRILSLDIDCVFDHMANVSLKPRMNEPGFQALLDAMGTERIWVKISSAFFPVDLERAQALIDRNVSRVVWASDWPHVVYGDTPDNIETLITNVVSLGLDSSTTRKIFVDNPSRLYFG